MSEILNVVVTQIAKFGWEQDKRHCWMDFNLNEETALRLSFSGEFLSELKIVLQQLEGLVSDDGENGGLPKTETTQVNPIDRIEFGIDRANQLALLRTRFKDGESQDTVLEKGHIQPTIQHLKECAEEFENRPRAPKH